MADLYVRSTDGDDADNGTTWALAKATLSGAAAIDAAGDRIYLSQSHAATALGAQTITLAGTSASPVWVIAGNDVASPPTTVATASEATSNGSSYTITGYAYVYGLTVSVGAGGATSCSITLANNVLGDLLFQSCGFVIDSTAGSSSANLVLGSAGTATTCKVVLKDCAITLGSSVTSRIVAASAEARIEGGSITATGSRQGVIAAGASTRATLLTVSGVNLSGLGAGAYLAQGGSAAAATRIVFRNCKLPASWTGGLTYSAVSTPAHRVELYNCDDGDTNYKLWIEDYAGAIIDETVIVRTGGASDGTTTISWKLVSTATAEYPLITLDTPEIVRWNETTGSAITATVEIVTDNVTLTDAECWLEVQYLGTSGYPLGSFVSDAKANVLASAANQTTSSETWTTTGLTTPVKQKLAVTFTPQEKGYIHAVVKLAKASTTVYVDPELTIT